METSLILISAIIGLIGGFLIGRFANKKETVVTDFVTPRKLTAPANYPLTECLEELKFGRKAEDQKQIDSFIKSLNN